MNKLIYGKPVATPNSSDLRLADPKELVKAGRLWVDFDGRLLLDGEQLTITLQVELTEPAPNPNIQLLGKKGHHLAMFIQKLEKQFSKRSLLIQYPQQKIWHGKYGQGSRLAGLCLPVTDSIDPILGKIPLIKGQCLVVLEYHNDKLQAKIYRDDPRRVAINFLARGLDHLGYRLPNFFFWQLFSKL